MKRKTYLQTEEDPLLVFEEERDEKGKLIYLKDHQPYPPTEKRFKYDTAGRLTEELEIADGLILHRQELIYNDKGDITEHNLYIADELFQQVKTEYKNEGFVRYTVQDGEEVDRQVKKMTGEKDFTTYFFNGEDLVQVQEYIYDAGAKQSIFKSYNADKSLIRKSIEKFNDAGEIISYHEYDNNNNLLEENVSEIEKDMIVKEHYRNFTHGEVEYIISYEYDQYGNEIKKQIQTTSGKLLDFYHYVYDDKQRLVEEQGYCSGSYDAIYGTHINNQEFHFIHEYES